MTRSAVGTNEIRSQIAYASTVVAFIIPNSVRAFPNAPRAVRAKSRCETCERFWTQIARWISANVAHTANAIDQATVIQLMASVLQNLEATTRPAEKLFVRRRTRRNCYTCDPTCRRCC